jgi:hypothetical protein
MESNFGVKMLLFLWRTHVGEALDGPLGVGQCSTMGARGGMPVAPFRGRGGAVGAWILINMKFLENCCGKWHFGW